MSYVFYFSVDGKVGFDNFMDFLSTHDDPEQEEKCILESFRSFDVDNKGVISSQDIRDVLMNVMEKCPEDDKKQILKVFHLDQDRPVTYEGDLFLHFLDFSNSTNRGANHSSKKRKRLQLQQKDF